MSELRIVFMGTPELACFSLAALTTHPGFQVVAVVTQPDRPKGRDLKVLPPPVKVLALERHLPVLQPLKLRDESFLAELRGLQPDLIAVAAYGRILPPGILELPRFGCLNVHTSLLPRHRGAAPIQWAILRDESETGVTLMKMDAGLDTGDLLAQRATPIRAEDNAQTLHDRLGQMGAELLVQTIPEYVAGRIQPSPQPAEGVSHAPKLTKEDGRIDWRQPARAVWCRVRAFTPWPGAFTFLPDPPQAHLLKIWQAEIAETDAADPGGIRQADKTGIIVGCGAGAVRLLSLQREGGRRMSAQEFLAGHPLKPGQRLG